MRSKLLSLCVCVLHHLLHIAMDFPPELAWRRHIHLCVSMCMPMKKGTPFWQLWCYVRGTLFGGVHYFAISQNLMSTSMQREHRVRLPPPLPSPNSHDCALADEEAPPLDLDTDDTYLCQLCAHKETLGCSLCMYFSLHCEVVSRCNWMGLCGQWQRELKERGF